jgi:hypothetical protein
MESCNPHRAESAACRTCVRACALRLRLPVQDERVERRGCALGRLALETARHGLQQLARVLEVAAPQQRGAFACEAVGGIGRRVMVGEHDAFRRRHARFGAPARRLPTVGLGPVDRRKRGGNSRRIGGCCHDRTRVAKDMMQQCLRHDRLHAKPVEGRRNIRLRSDGLPGAIGFLRVRVKRTVRVFQAGIGGHRNDTGLRA